MQRRIAVLVCAVQVEVFLFEIFAHALQIIAYHGDKKVFVQILRFGFLRSFEKGQHFLAVK